MINLKNDRNNIDTGSAEEGVQQEMLDALEKIDNPVARPTHEVAPPADNNCCTIL